MNNSLKIFVEFLKRDLYTCKKHLATYIINFAILNTAVASFAFCYLQATTFFGSANTKAATTLFSGSICLALFIISYKKTIPLLYDLDKDRFIDYQISILSPRLVLLEKIVFNSLFTFLLVLPFFPLAKLIVQDRLNTQATSWPLIACILLAGSFACSAYNMFTAVFLKGPNDLTQLWARFNIPMLIMSGFVPWYLMVTLSPYFGYAMLLNPMIYITEGVRQAFLDDNKFLSIGTCIIALFIITATFTHLAWHFFKKRTDHI